MCLTGLNVNTMRFVIFYVHIIKKDNFKRSVKKIHFKARAEFSIFVVLNRPVICVMLCQARVDEERSQQEVQLCLSARRV